MKIEAARRRFSKNYEKGKGYWNWGTAWNYYSGSDCSCSGRKSEKKLRSFLLTVLVLRQRF